jgi:hypothetical protein
MKYANITPKTIIFNKPEADRLLVVIQSDDLTSTSIFRYTLQSGGNVLMVNSISCTGEAYTDWDGNNDFPFNFVADTIGVEIIDIVEEVPETPIEETPEENLEEAIEE